MRNRRLQADTTKLMMHSAVYCLYIDRSWTPYRLQLAIWDSCAIMLFSTPEKALEWKQLIDSHGRKHLTIKRMKRNTVTHAIASGDAVLLDLVMIIQPREKDSLRDLPIITGLRTSMKPHHGN